MQALLLVDIQNDFTPGEPGGVLAVPNGDEVIPVANRSMLNYELVVAMQDWHPPDHKSFASQHPGRQIGEVIDLEGLEQILWPDHCVQNTIGVEFCAELNMAGIHKVVRKGTAPDIDSYSGFFDNGHRKATGLTQLLREHSVTTVDVMGLATDYCVKFTALDAIKEGFATRLIVAGCRGVELNTGDCAIAMEQMMAAGVEMIVD